MRLSASVIAGVAVLWLSLHVAVCVCVSVQFGGRDRVVRLCVCERACDHIRECVLGRFLRSLRLCLPV